MKKLKYTSLSALIAIILVFTNITVWAETKAGATSSDESYLKYQAQSLNWSDDEVTVTGYFINVTTDKDIYDIKNASFVINDADGNPAISTTLNSRDLSEIQLAPGEKWEYSVVRTISGFNPATYNVQNAFSVRVSKEISIRDHGANCSYCAARDNPTFKTVDTMSEEEWQMLVAKLKAAVGNESPGQNNSPDINYDPVPYTPIPVPENTKRNCTKCGGSGKLTCTHCNGVGYKEHREQATCLVAHHTDCYQYPAKGVCRPSCHERHDFYWKKDKCTWCNGTGLESCSLCRGIGTLNY